MPRFKVAILLASCLMACTGCGLLDWVKSLGGSDVDCPESGTDPITLELMVVNDVQSCDFLWMAELDLDPDGPVRVEEQHFMIKDVPGPPCQLVSTDREALSAELEALSPPEEQMLALGREQSSDGTSVWKAYLLETPAQITGEHVEKARVEQNEQMMVPVVMVDLTDEGTRLFGDLTGMNKGKRLAIVVNGEVVSAPIIQERIPGGKMQITLGSSGPQDQIYCRAKAIADSLNGG